MNTITARTVVQGLHHWPGAPDRRAYLRHPHRHRFGIAVTIGVAHKDRDTEWQDLADSAEDAMRQQGEGYHADTNLYDFGPQSCERLAAALGRSLLEAGYDVRAVEVDEDGEHTARWETGDDA